MDTWQMKVVVMVQADEPENVALLLREIARAVKRGATSGGGNHCAGVYSFDIADFEGKPLTEDVVTEEQAAEYNQMLADQELEENLLAALPDTTDFDSEW